jgi:FHS family L-fucose permease-like MFS transporter
MAMPIQTQKPVDAGAVHAAGGASGYRSALTLLASLFFMWGFITVINNTLLPHLRSVFDLSYTQTTLIESVWFIAYFFASIPSAKLIERVGYQRAMVFGLGLMAVGAVMMVPAARLPSYGVTLIALFVIASGITLLQVAANPYVAVVGPPETASSRLNLVQAFNSAGATLAPLFGGYLILGRSTSGTAAAGSTAVLTQAERVADAQSVVLPYLIVAAVLVVLAIVIARFPLPAMGSATQRSAKADRKGQSLWSHRNLVFGIPAIFIYLIALPVRPVGRDDGWAADRQRRDAHDSRRTRAGVCEHRCMRRHARRNLHHWPCRDVGADLGRVVPLHHVPDDFYAGH